MQEPDGNEMDRILGLVEQGKVSPEGAERLIASIETRRQIVRCPYCAETIPAGRVVCPECASPLAAAPVSSSAHSTSARDLSHLTGLRKFLVIYAFVITLIVMVSNLGFHWSLQDVAQTGLGILGLIAAVLICKDHPTGWGLGMLWAGLQVVEVVVGGHILNRQVLAIDFIWTTNGSGLGINLVGIVLLILFIKARGSARTPSEATFAARYNQGGYE